MRRGTVVPLLRGGHRPRGGLPRGPAWRMARQLGRGLGRGRRGVEESVRVLSPNRRPLFSSGIARASRYRGQRHRRRAEVWPVMASCGGAEQCHPDGGQGCRARGPRRHDPAPQRRPPSRLCGPPCRGRGCETATEWPSERCGARVHLRSHGFDGSAPALHWGATYRHRQSLCLGFLFPNHVSEAACRARIVCRMMAHERILDYVSQGGKRIRSQELRLLPDSISAASSHNLL